MTKNKRIQHDEGATRNLLPHSTEESEVRAIRYGGKTRVIRLTNKEQATTDFAKHSIFHHFFPKNSLSPIAVHSFIDEKGNERWGMVSEMVRGQSKSTIVARNAVYSEIKRMRRPYRQREKHKHWDDHDNFIYSTAYPIKDKAYDEYGVQINTFTPNVANVSGNPVFFELDIRKPDLLRSKIEEIPNKEKRTKLLFHFNEWDDLEQKRKKAAEEYQRRWQKEQEEKHKARAGAQGLEEQRRRERTVWGKIRKVVSSKRKPKK